MDLYKPITDTLEFFYPKLVKGGIIICDDYNSTQFPGAKRAWDEFFKDKKVNDTLTVQVISSDPKGLLVKPEGSELQITIKKSQIAINSADARPSRFVGGERIDAAISEINTEKRKVALSIRLLEELKNKEALDKYSDPLSGKNLPFSSLSDKIEKKKE